MSLFAHKKDYTDYASDLRDTADKAINYAKDFFHQAGQDANDKVHYLTRRVKKEYPDYRDAFKSEAKKLRKSASAKSGEAKGYFDSLGDDFSRGVHNVADGAYGMVSTVAKIGLVAGIFKILTSDETKAELTDTGAKIKARIKEKPVESAVIAAGIGYLIGRILR